SWSSRVTLNFAPSRHTRATARERAKFSVVMLAPKTTSSAEQPRKPAPARRASATRASVCLEVSKSQPTFAFDSRRYVAIAAITSSGTCVPPGPSKKASSRRRAEKRLLTATTSSATVAIAQRYQRFYEFRVDLRVKG